MLTIRLVDVEIGDLVRITGHKRSWLVIGLDRIRNEVTLDYWEADGKGYRPRVFGAEEIIGHFRQLKHGWELVWSCYRKESAR